MTWADGNSMGMLTEEIWAQSLAATSSLASSAAETVMASFAIAHQSIRARLQIHLDFGFRLACTGTPNFIFRLRCGGLAGTVLWTLTLNRCATQTGFIMARSTVRDKGTVVPGNTGAIVSFAQLVSGSASLDINSATSVVIGPVANENTGEGAFGATAGSWNFQVARSEFADQNFYADKVFAITGDWSASDAANIAIIDMAQVRWGLGMGSFTVV